MPKYRAITPDSTIEREYRTLLQTLTARMGRQYINTIRSAYEHPSRAFLLQVLRALNRRWTQQFDFSAPTIAKRFARHIQTRTDTILKRILQVAGIAALWHRAPKYRDVEQEIISNNAAIIQSIPRQYHNRVLDIISQAVRDNQDLDTLTDQLQQIADITNNRAKLVAEHQNNLATNSLFIARLLQIGITHGRWYHDQPHDPRITHIRMHGKRFRLDQGMFDHDPEVLRNIFPGELYGCKCYFVPELVK